MLLSLLVKSYVCLVLLCCTVGLCQNVPSMFVNFSTLQFGPEFVQPGPNETTFLEEVVECDCSVTALEVVKLQLDKHCK